MPDHDAEGVLSFYSERILPGCPARPYRLVGDRLETFSPQELLLAIERFAADPWRMSHNARLGPEWFFATDERIRTFLALGDSARRPARPPAREEGLPVLRRYLGSYYPLFYDEQGNRLPGTWGPMGERAAARGGSDHGHS